MMHSFIPALLRFFFQPYIITLFLPRYLQLSTSLYSLHPHLSTFHVFSAFFPPRLLPHLCFFHALLCFLYSQPSITPFFLTCRPLFSSFPAFHTLFFSCLSQLSATLTTSGPFYLPGLHLPSAQAFMLTFPPYMPSSAVCSPSIHAHLSTLHAFICRLLP